MHSTKPRFVHAVGCIAFAMGVMTSLAGSAVAQVADTHVDLGALTATAGRAPVDSPGLRAGIANVVSQLDARCYQPALARRAGLAGELQVRATLGRSGRLSSVAVTRSRGATLTPAVSSCVRRAFAAARFDEAEPGNEAAGRPREARPVRLSFRIAFRSPPAPAQPPPAQSSRRCGPSPAGCVSTGCRAGLYCDTSAGCHPSGCGCDPDTGTWTCTADCGGGQCVPERNRQRSSEGPPASERGW